MRRVSMLLAALLLLSGCTPGGPGSAAPHAAAGTSGAGSRHVSADVTFVRSLIPHHQRGIVLASAVARVPAAHILAEAIIVTQQDEVARMSGWLREWSASAPPSVTRSAATAPPSTAPSPASPTSIAPSSSTAPSHATAPSPATAPSIATETASAPAPAAHSRAAAPGPATPTRAAGPRSATSLGAAEDSIRALIAHQQEAIELAQREQAGGANPAALAFARQIIESRTEEIAQLRAYLG